MMNIDDTIRERIRKRIDQKFLSILHSLGINSIYIAGNSLNRNNPNDIDMYPVEVSAIEKFGHIITVSNVKTMSMTKNALTLRYNSVTYQLCNFHKSSLENLVDSFDFAHIKLGALIQFNEYGFTISQIYLSEDWKNAQLAGGTYFTGSEYPLSSLLRTFKYKERGDFSGNQHIYSVLTILHDIVDRGFTDYNDFKNQLDAVDLGLVPEDLDGCQDILRKLFDVLLK